METSETTALKPPPPPAFRIPEREHWESLPEAEQEERIRELVVMMRELDFEQEDLADEPRYGRVHFNTVACAAYLLQEMEGSSERRYNFQWDWSQGITTRDVPTVYYTEDIEEIKAAWEGPIEWVDARVDALDKVRELLDPPKGFPGRRTDWLVLVATVHRLEPGFNTCSNRLDLTHPDSKDLPLWDIVKGNACRVDPQDLVDTAYGRLIRLNIGDEYSDYSDDKYATLVTRATRSYPGGEVDLDTHIGKVVRKAAYKHMQDTRYL